MGHLQARMTCLQFLGHERTTTIPWQSLRRSSSALGWDMSVLRPPRLLCNSYVMLTVNKMCQDKAHMLHAVADQKEYLGSRHNRALTNI